MATQYFADPQQMSPQQLLPPLLGSNFCSPYPSTFFVQEGKSCIRRGIPVTVLDSEGQLAFTQEKNAKTMKVSRAMKTAEGKTICNFLSKVNILHDGQLYMQYIPPLRTNNKCHLQCILSLCMNSHCCMQYMPPLCTNSKQYDQQHSEQRQSSDSAE